MRYGEKEKGENKIKELRSRRDKTYKEVTLYKILREITVIK